MKAYIKPAIEVIDLAEAQSPLCDLSANVDADQNTDIVVTKRQDWEDSEDWANWEEEE